MRVTGRVLQNHKMRAFRYAVIIGRDRPTEAAEILMAIRPESWRYEA